MQLQMSQTSPKTGRKVLHRLRRLKWNLKAQSDDKEATHDEFPPVSRSPKDKDKKPWINIDPRWKVRIQAVIIICLLVVPGNLVTLFIYTTSELSSNQTLSRNESRLDNSSDDTSDYDLFDDYVTDHNFTEINETWDDDGNSSSYLTEDGYFCHEKYEVIIPILDSVHFWIEGVTLTTIALFGLLGNLLTVVVILNFDRAPPHNPTGGGRSPFNTILITLVAFDSFFLIFSLFDSGLLASFHMPEPYW